MQKRTIKDAFHLTLATIAGIVCLHLTLDEQQGWNDFKRIANVKWNAA